MNKPDLTTKAGRKAYRHDMRMVAIRPRRISMALLAIGIALMLLPLAGVHDLSGWSPRFLGLIGMVASLPFLIVAQRRRGAYARQHRGEKPHLPG